MIRLGSWDLLFCDYAIEHKGIIANHEGFYAIRGLGFRTLHMECPKP